MPGRETPATSAARAVGKRAAMADTAMRTLRRAAVA
jgi:hypothetical protein